MSQFGLPNPNDNDLEDDRSERFYKLHFVGIIMARRPSLYFLLTQLLG